MVLLEFLIEWGTNVFAISAVAVTACAFVSVARWYLGRNIVVEKNVMST